MIRTKIIDITLVVLFITAIGVAIYTFTHQPPERRLPPAEQMTYFCHVTEQDSRADLTVPYNGKVLACYTSEG